jgi:hypothetical protein
MGKAGNGVETTLTIRPDLQFAFPDCSVFLPCRILRLSPGTRAMKGPYERLKYDLRRLWECPVCQRRERAPGSQTTRHCLCLLQKAGGKPVVMKLIEDGVQRTVPPVVLVHEPLPPLPPLELPGQDAALPPASSGPDLPAIASSAATGADLPGVMPPANDVVESNPGKDKSPE